MFIKTIKRIQYLFKKILYQFVDFELLFRNAGKNGRKKILIIRIDSMGDFIIFSPMLKYYRKLYPDYSITLIANKNNKELAERFNNVDRIIYFDRKEFDDNILYRRELLLDIRNEGWDIAIYPVYSREPKGDYLMKISGAKQRIGFDGDLSNISVAQKKKSDKYYTKLIKINSNVVSEIEKNKKFIEELGIKVDDNIPFFIPSASDDKEAEQILLRNKAGRDVKFAVIHPGAGDIQRMWPIDKYCQLIEWLKIKKSLQIIICGSESERYLAKQTKEKIDFPIIDITGETSLPVLAAILKKAVIYIGNDAGPVHLAIAVGAPTVCLTGGGHPGRFFPWGDPINNKVIYHKMPCFGCDWFCKYDAAKCARDITLKQVIDAINQILR